MALLTDIIKNSSTFFNALNNSLNSTRKSFLNLNSSVSGINKRVSSNIKIKRELFSKNQSIDRIRQEASLRRELEDKLEASKISTSATGALGLARSSSGPPFSRLLNVLGYITAGWIVENIPTWTFMGKEFVSRIGKVGSSLGRMTGDIKDISGDFSSLLKNSFVSLATFNFKDFTEGSVSKSFESLNKNLQEFGDKLSNAFGVFSVPLTQSLDGTRRAPGLGQQPSQTYFPEQPAPGSSNQTRASYGTKEQRAMLDAIAWAEGGISYRTMFGGGQFDISNGWKHPDKVVRSNGLYSTAAGRYQFLTPTWNEAASTLGLKDFSPINQDRAAIFLMDRGLGRNSAEILRTEGTSNKVLNTFAQIWAAVPMSGGGSYYGQSAVKVNQFKDKYNSLLKTVDMQTNQPQQTQPSTTLVSNSFFAPVSGTSGSSMGNKSVSLPYSPFKPNSGVVITSIKGKRWGRDHNGWDIAGEEGTPIYAYLPGVVTHVNKNNSYGNGYGWWVIWRDSVYGSYHFFAHMKNPSPLNVGDSVNQGTLMGLMGSTGKSTGPHLHWEISKNSPRKNGQFISYEDIGDWTRKNPLIQTSPTQRRSSNPTPSPAAVISPLPPLSDLPVASQLAPPEEKSAADTIIFAPQPQNNLSIVPSAQTSQISASSTMNDFRLLNNFIKNKLLLDLAYL